MPTTRKLAAIMFTDIEGYTALMQQDEQKAILIRDRHRNIFNTITEKHKGNVLQYYGDGTLSIFDSAIDAVKCGVEMQLAFREEPAIPVRIGIHTGDIVFSDEEIIGDGVNVASRIESLATVGSVFISDKVHDEIKNQSDIETSMLKTFQLKNVEKPVLVYAISNEGLIVPKLDEIKGKTADAIPNTERSSTNLKRTLITIVAITVLLIISYLMKQFAFTEPEIPERSIAVLAFENMSGDPEQEYFSDGISEEILNVLTNVEGLKVAGRTSAFSFKGKKEDIRTIGKNLDVKMVLEGSVRRAGDQVRVTAQLISVEDGFHLWSEAFDREMKDIFAIQGEIAERIVERLKLQILEPGERVEQTKNMEAYDLVLKGVYFLDKDFEGTRKAMEYFQKAVELDPDYADAYAWIGDAYTNYASYGFMTNAEAYTNARTAAQKAIKLDEYHPRAHKILAYVHLYYDWDWEAALHEYRNAVQYGLRAPDHFITFYDVWLQEDFNHAIAVCEQLVDRDLLEIEGHWHLGFCYYVAGRHEEALLAFDNALELDPNYSEGYAWKGLTLMTMQRYQEATNSLEKALQITQGQGPALLYLLMVKSQTGNEEEVIQTLDQWLESGEYIEPLSPAMLYTILGNEDEALEWLEKGYRERSLFMISLKAFDIWDPLRDNPRFIEIYEKLNFPD